MSIAASARRTIFTALSVICFLGCSVQTTSPVDDGSEEVGQLSLNETENSTLVGDAVSSTEATSSDSSGLEENTLALNEPDSPSDSSTTETTTTEPGTNQEEAQNSINKTEQLIAEQGLEPTLVGLSLEDLGKGKNRVVAEVTAAGTYTVRRTAPSEHVVTLEDAKISPDALRTLVSPPQGGMIRSVRPVQDGNNVLLRIFANPDVELTTEVASGKIVISTKPDPLASPRAQLSDEVTTPEVKTETTVSETVETTTTTTAEVAKEEVAADASKPEVKEVSTEVESDTPLESDISALLEGEPKYTGKLISLDLQDTDIDNALRIIAEVSNLNIITSDKVAGKVTLRLIDVPWDQALDVILKTNGLDKVQEGNVIRVAPVEKLRAEREALKEAQRADEDLQPLMVRYIRISYAKASEVKPLVEAVLSERGAVAVDGRTNQIIVKDIQKGIQNVVELVQKLDLRTPQVLLETQIVEANRNFMRDLGSEVGLSFIRSPATGNATGYNFPNAVTVQGSQGTNNTGSSFPAAVSGTVGSAITALFDSADGSKTLALRLSSAEKEGRVRIVSRPSVATINNKKASIKSVEKIRVKTPDSGLSVATGEGATSQGGAAVATETFEVGIVLDVTPQASPDYFVLLDINAKSSTLGSQTVDGIPSEIERSATSTVLVSSGQTFALGGIYKIKDSDNIDGVPFFKDMPVFGQFFRRTLVDNSDEELIFFITPRIVEGSFDDAAMKATL